MTGHFRRIVVGILLVVGLLFSGPNTVAPVSAQTDWCNYFVGQYAWYEHQYNTYLNLYFQSGDDFYANIAEMYFQQMVNLVPAIQAYCGGYGPTP